MKNQLILAMLAVLGPASCGAAIIDVNMNAGPLTPSTFNGNVTFVNQSATVAASVFSLTLSQLNNTLLFTNSTSNPPDFTAPNNGERLVLVLDNETGQTLTGLSFTLSGQATYYTLAPKVPDVGTYTGGGTPTYQFVPPPNPGNTGVTGSVLTINLASTPWASGSTAALHIDFNDVSLAAASSTFTLDEVAVTATPEPATLAIGGIGLALLGLVGRLRRRRS